MKRGGKKGAARGGRKAGRLGKWIRRLALGLGLAIVAAAAVPLWTLWSEHRFWTRPQDEMGSGSAPLSVEEGMSAAALAQELERARIVGPAARVLDLMRRRGRERDIQPGEYVLPRPISPRSVFEALGRSGTAAKKVTIPEGLDLAQTAEVFEKNGVGEAKAFAAAFRDPAPARSFDAKCADLEGYLFPGTYRVSVGAAPERVARALVRAYERRFLRPNKGKLERLRLSPREATTVASMVEKETAKPEERAKIAGVFYERLRRGMKMQCDPTVIFAAKRAGAYDGKIHKRDLERKDPYNTYEVFGLPPGPIASPGLAALTAAVEPERTEALYFVADGKGGHTFSANLEAHNKAVHRRVAKKR